ncbi:hypothetical protein DE146DRAFT_659881 [Phaeosphaeria sp. MPI-PUGE-AT-0046c]|nr:hypothetical protein DE146DRAFT_659881 [Phaeosphaeria sp. MPI-PUGE-AT-0046c]
MLWPVIAAITSLTRSEVLRSWCERPAICKQDVVAKHKEVASSCCNHQSGLTDRMPLASRNFITEACAMVTLGGCGRQGRQKYWSTSGKYGSPLVHRRVSVIKPTRIFRTSYLVRGTVPEFYPLMFMTSVSMHACSNMKGHDNNLSILMPQCRSSTDICFILLSDLELFQLFRYVS